MRKWTHLSCFLLLLVAVCAYPQHDTISKAWTAIELSIKTKKDLGIAESKLIEIRKAAERLNNEAAIARTFHLQMLIADLKKEDTLYFRNSSFIDSFLFRNPTPTMELLLHLLQSKRLIHFQHKSLRFGRSKYEQRNLPYNYAAFSYVAIDSIIEYHFGAARAIALTLNNARVEDYLWLSTDPLVFLYKPVLYDLIAAGRIDYFARSLRLPPSLQDDLFDWVQLSQEEMIMRIAQLPVGDDRGYDVLNWYGDWLSFNRNRSEAYYYIETHLRKWMLNNNFNAEIDSLYEIYLQKISVSPINTVRAHGVYQLCLWWNKESKKYFPPRQLDYDSEEIFQERYQYLGVKALELFERNQQLLDSFSYLKSILITMKDQLLSPSLQMELDNYHLPGEHILATLTYKNTQRLYYRIIKTGYYDETVSSATNLVRELMKKIPIRETKVELKLPQDHNSHRTHLIIDGLSNGNYYVLFNDRAFPDTNGAINYVRFEVKSLAILKSENRVYILDRKTGAPISGQEPSEAIPKRKKRISYCYEYN